MEVSVLSIVAMAVFFFSLIIECHYVNCVTDPDKTDKKSFVVTDHLVC